MLHVEKNSIIIIKANILYLPDYINNLNKIKAKNITKGGFIKFYG